MTTSTPISEIRNVSACVSVADLDRSAAWYRDHLGLREVQRMDFPDLPARVAYLESPGARIELLESPDYRPAPRPDPPRHGAMQGVTQLSLEVDDVGRAAEQVGRHSVDVAMSPITNDQLGLKVMFIRDNDGNLIELVQRLPSAGAGR